MMIMMNMKFTKTFSSSRSGGCVLWRLHISKVLAVLTSCQSLFADSVVSAAAAFLTTTSTSSLTLNSCSFQSSKTLAYGLKSTTTTTRSTPTILASASSSLPTTTAAASSPRECVYQGMQAFRHGNVVESIQLFDLAERLSSNSNDRSSLTPFLWQRGISYYYVNDFEKAKRQFRTDVAVNPSDVEEIVWEIASQLRIQPDIFPVPNALSLPPGKQDSRRIMSTIYQLFKGLATEQDLAMAGLNNNSKPFEEFYTLFYLALYNDARGGGGENSSSKALHYMRQALHTPYAKANNADNADGGGDYMVAVARVHCQLRGGLL